MMYTIGSVAFFIHIETKPHTKKKKKIMAPFFYGWGSTAS